MVTNAHRVRNRAKMAVKRALATGELERLPCDRCGATPADAHHPDYTKPLDVRWLCRDHHTELHNARRATRLPGLSTSAPTMPSLASDRWKLQNDFIDAAMSDGIELGYSRVRWL